MSFRKTPVAADELGDTYHQLISLLRFRKIQPPARDTSGDYVWTDADLNRARRAFAAMRRPKVEAVAS